MVPLVRCNLLQTIFYRNGDIVAFAASWEVKDNITPPNALDKILKLVVI
jgi:hypothetical protein